MTRWWASLLGYGIIAALFCILALPLFVALFMATNRLQYRAWLAGLAFLISLVFLEFSADYIYNIIHWTTNRPSMFEAAASLALLVISPLFLAGLILKRSRRKWQLGLAMLPLFGLVAFGIQREYADRAQRDQADYQKAISVLSPQTGTLFVRCQIKYRADGQDVYLQGHVAEGARVTLLADPFSPIFQPQYCSGIAGSYRPPVSDPAALSNVTETGRFQGYSLTARYSMAVLERVVTRYEVVPFEPMPGSAVYPALSDPLVQTRFKNLRYDAANLDLARPEIRRGTGERGETLFVAAIKPRHLPSNIFPCNGPALVVSVGSPGHPQAVLPYCSVSWNLFQLNDELYFSAITEEPTPRGQDIMGPDRTEWLFRVESSALRQIWPAP